MIYGLSELFKYRNFLERYSVEFLRLAERLEEQIQQMAHIPSLQKEGQ